MREDCSPPHSQAPTDSCAAVTADENPGPLGEVLPLLIPSSPSMNTRQSPRSRPSYSEGGRTRERHPELEAAEWERRPPCPAVPCPFPAIRGSQASPAFRIERVPESSVGPRLPGGSALETSGSPGETPLAPPSEAGRGPPYPGLEPCALALRHPTPLGTPHRSHRQQAPSPALGRGALPCTPARRNRVPGRPRAQPTPNRSWAAGNAPPAGQAPGGEPERSRGPVAWGGRGRPGGEPGHLRAGSGEPHGQEHVQRRSMLDGAGALLAVPPRGDFAVQLLSRSHAERAGVAVLSHAQRPAIAREGAQAGGSRRAEDWPGAGAGARGPGAGREAAAAALGASPVSRLTLPGEATGARTARRERLLPDRPSAPRGPGAPCTAPAAALSPPPLSFSAPSSPGICTE